MRTTVPVHIIHDCTTMEKYLHSSHSLSKLLAQYLQMHPWLYMLFGREYRLRVFSSQHNLSLPFFLPALYWLNFHSEANTWACEDAHAHCGSYVCVMQHRRPPTAVGGYSPIADAIYSHNIMYSLGYTSK